MFACWIAWRYSEHTFVRTIGHQLVHRDVLYDHEVYNHATKHDAKERRPWHNRIQYCMKHNEDPNVPRVPRQSVRGRGTFGARAMRCTAAGVPSASSYFGAKFYEVLVVWELLETVVAGINCTT